MRLLLTAPLGADQVSLSFSSLNTSENIDDYLETIEPNDLPFIKAHGVSANPHEWCIGKCMRIYGHLAEQRVQHQGSQVLSDVESLELAAKSKVRSVSVTY